MHTREKVNKYLFSSTELQPLLPAYRMNYNHTPNCNSHLALVFALIATLLSIKPAVGQKNRAVVNDITTLLEVLQRNYDAIDDSEVRTTTIQNDRTTVISIFTAYTKPNDYRLNVASPRIENQTSLLLIKRLRLSISMLSVTATQDKVADTQTKILGLYALNDQIGEETALINERLFNYDIDVLRFLSDYFQVRNPYLSLRIGEFITKFTNVNSNLADPLAVSAGTGQVQKSLNLFGGSGMTFTNAVDGLAMFLAKRIKEELAAQIFDRIKRQLSQTDSAQDKFLELKMLLPRTTNLLRTISPDQYAGVVNSLKENIEKDLDNLIDNLPQLSQSPKFKRLIADHPEVEFAFMGVQLINDLNKIKSPTEIIFVLENSTLMTKWSKDKLHSNFVNGVKLGALLVYAITEDYLESRRFISPDELDKYFKDEKFYDLFIGFLIQQDEKYYDIHFGDIAFRQQLISEYYRIIDWYSFLAPKLKDLARQASSIEDEIAALKKIKESTGKAPVDSVAHMLKSSITFLDSTLSVSNSTMKKFVPGIDIKFKSRLYFSAARKAVDVYSDIGSKQYYNAIVDAITLVDDLENQTNGHRKVLLNGLLNKMKEDSILLRNLEKEARSGTITANTVDKLVVLANGIGNSCLCTAYARFAHLPSANIDSTEASFADITRTFNSTDQVFKDRLLQLRQGEVSQILDQLGLRHINLSISATQSLDSIRKVVRNQINAIVETTVKDADVLKIVNFLVALSKAQSADEFEKAIEAIVLPSGSAIVKRESAWNLSLNAYAGFFYGEERIYNSKDGNADARNLAFTAPIGIAISKSFGKPCDSPRNDCKKSGSWTLFASIIDIGAFTSVRFSNSSATLPEITFQNILAPGAQLIWGIPKSAFSIAGGIQYGPMLRKVNLPTATNTITTTTTSQTTVDLNGVSTTTNTVSTAATASIDEKSAFRYGISILIDIPLINFYTKSKAYNK